LRVALCYHGIAKGQNFKNGGLPVGYDHEFHLMKQHLIENNQDCEFDIFLHSWSLEYKEEIVEKLKPEAYIFEPSREFKKASISKTFKEGVKKMLGRGYEKQRVNNIYSRWYSFKKVCDLVKESEKTYDLVIVTRFDMCLLSAFDLSALNAQNFYSGDWVTYYENGAELKEENYPSDQEKAKPVQKGHPYDKEGLQDFFFISSQEYMISSFSNIFDNLKYLLKKYGPSNHLIALGKLKEDKMLDKHKRVMMYGKDYFLSRWI